MQIDGWLGAVALLSGSTLILGVVLDVAYSTLSARGAGPLLRFTARRIWRLSRPAVRRLPGRSGYALAGPVVLLGGLAMWMLMLWAGWWLVFLGDTAAVLDSQTRTAADALQRLYYAGVSITTLGVGDFVAGNPLWRLLTVGAGLSGFTVLTLSVTFVVSLLGAAAEKRAVADYVTALGATPQALTHDATRLSDHVPALTGAVSGIAQKYAAYPLLQYYHTTGGDASLALRVAALSDAVLALRAQAPDDSGERLQPLQRSLQSLAATLHEVHLEQPATAPPEPPVVSDDRAASDDQLRADAEALRRSLFGFVQWEGWSWADVHEDPLPR